MWNTNRLGFYFRRLAIMLAKKDRYVLGLTIRRLVMFKNLLVFVIIFSLGVKMYLFF